jgi:hypothetical protein
MSTDPTATPTLDLVAAIGPVAAREFEGAKIYEKPKLLAWIERLPSQTDDEFAEECSHAIYGSALAMRFRGNWEADHCRASACFHESRRRLVRDGHAEDCRGPSIYSRAHSALMRGHGYAPTADGECRCDLGGDRV